MLNKNTLGVKKVRGQEEAALWMNQRLKDLISSKAKKFRWLFMKQVDVLPSKNQALCQLNYCK